MTDARTFILSHPQARRGAMQCVAEAPEGHCVIVKPKTRSLEQNSAQWPILEAFSRQLKWPVNGEFVHMAKEEWKDVLTAAFKQERVRMAMGLDGGVVMLGQRTRDFAKPEFSDWLDFLHATAAIRGVSLTLEACTA